MPLPRLALGLALTFCAFAAQPFTIEQILSAPFSSELTASPQGDAVAWVTNTKGVRNVWVALAPRFEGAPITHFAADDGQELSGIAWKPDSSGLYFTRGGDPNGRGEFPNPDSNPAGVRQEIWFATVSGDAHRVGDGQGAAVSADGSLVAWVLSGQIWSAATAISAKPAQMMHARGSAENLVWSPTDHNLAFRSVRTDHSFIGLYNTDKKTLRYLDPSLDRDQFPSWSPDGRKIAFVRLPASRYAFMHGAKRIGEPWSILVAEAETNGAREVWRSGEGRGSVFWPVNAENQLLWTSGDRIVFPWERDGWLHLYSVSSGGGAATLLTPGEYEVEHVALARDANTILYSSNENDADRRHLWRLPLPGGKREEITPGAGIEWSPAPLLNGRIALLHSDFRLPGRPAVAEAGKLRDLTPAAMPDGFPSDSLVTPQQVIFPAADGLKIHGQLFLPPVTGQSKHPAMIFFHGGSRREMLLGWHYMFYYHQTYAFNQYLASKGFVVLSVNYRSGTGYGEEFREALNYGPTGASEYNDVIGAGLYLRNRSDVEESRVGLWGGSYGGYLTALGLARASNLFAAGVDMHGVHDWNLEINNFVPVYEPQRRLDIARVAFESSPMAWVNSWKSPVLLIHGDDDRNVPFAESIQLAEALRQHRVPFERVIFPDEVHDFLLFSHWIRAYNAAADFLDRTLVRKRPQ